MRVGPRARGLAGLGLVGRPYVFTARNPPTTYQAYLSGKLEDYAYPEEAIRAALETLPKVNLMV